MAVYGTYYSAYQNGQRMRVTVSYVQEVDKNQSTVTVEYVQEVASGYVADSSWNMGAAINSVQMYSSTQYRNIAATTHIATTARSIPHNADGTKTVPISVSSTTGSTALFRQSIAQSIVLPTIPRAGKPSWSGDFEAGVAKSISIPKSSSSYTQDAAVFMGGYALQLASGTSATTVSWTPPLSILEEIPNAASGGGFLRVFTYSGATKISSVDVPFTLVAPATVKPVVSAVTWDDLNTTVKSVIGAFVQGLSLIKGVVTAAGVYGSTITEKQLLLAGSPVPENTPIQVGISGTVTASGEATDTRGRVGVLAANLTILPYEPPKLGANGWQVRRANVSNVPDDNGAYLRIDLHASAKSLINGTEKNALTVTVRTRPLTGGAWTNRNVVNPGLTQNGAIQVSGGAAFPINSSWEVEITLSDKTGSTPTVLKTGIGTAKVAFHLGPNGVGVGKLHEQGALDVAGDIYASGVKVSVDGHTHTGAQVAAATTGARGTAQIASAAEVVAGTDAAKYVTSAALRDAVTVGTFTPASGWSIYTGHASYLLLRGTTVRLTCTVQLATGGAIANLGSVPAAFRPPIATFAGVVVASNTPAHFGAVRVGADGKVDIPYFTNAVVVATFVPMVLEWEI